MSPGTPPADGRFCLHCGWRNPGDARHCNGCGKEIGSEPVHAEGRTLVVFRNAALPPFCVKCGVPVPGPPLRQKYSWHSPLLYLLVLGGCLGLIVYLIVAHSNRKRFEIELPLCDVHLRRRKKLRGAGAVLALGAVPAGIGLGQLPEGEPLGWLAGTVLFLAGAVCLLLGTNVLRPKRIDDDRARFEGAGEAFLRRLETEAGYVRPANLL